MRLGNYLWFQMFGAFWPKELRGDQMVAVLKETIGGGIQGLGIRTMNLAVGRWGE